MLSLLLLTILFSHSDAFSYQQICNYQDQSSLLGFSAHISTSLLPPLNWSSSTDCCRWEGINCDMNGKVTHLQLPFRGLKGVITSFINNLTSLTHLNLSNNFLRGPLGEGIVSLTNLRIIDLSIYYGISGSIPKEIGNLLYLEKLHLGINSISGPIPSSLMNCKNLIEIMLRDNLLEGNISILDFSKLRKLQKLDMGSNCFNGTLPESIYSCKSLIAIRVSRNNLLIGEISPKIVALRFLSFLSLGDNYFTNITKALRVLAKCKNLTTLFLSLNFYNEILPIHKDFIGLNDFPKLRFLNIGNCSFGGPIPNWLSNMKRLNFLSLVGNKFIGRIPDWVGNLPNLSTLHLEHNYLSGEFPQMLCKLPALVSNDTNLQTYPLELPLYFISDDYKNFIQVKAFRREINLSYNKLSGNIPLEIGNLQNLQILNLSNNNFSQKIPDSISNLKNMEILDLSTNSLTGEIPTSFASLHFLSEFNVSYNNLEGPIPTGGQLDTFQASSFEGNPGLCGEPVNQSCSNAMSKTRHGGKQVFIGGLFIGFAYGFCGVLAIIAACLWFNYYQRPQLSS